MEHRNLKKKRNLRREIRHPLHTLQTLISAIQSPEGLNPGNMKSLYGVLVHLSLNKPATTWSKCKSASSCIDMKLDKLRFEDLHSLSDFLFNELDVGFKDFFSVLHDVPISTDSDQAVLVKNIWAKSEGLMVLLRCCMVLLILMEFNPELCTVKGRLLLSILGRLMSTELSGGGNDKNSLIFKRSISLECAYIIGDCTASVTEESVASITQLEPSYLCYTLICRALEVFADELLMHRPLRGYFMLIDSASSRSETLFNFHFGHGNIGSVLEVICAHLFLSVSDELAFVNFIRRLVWSNKDYVRIPEISLSTALSLLFSPVMLSAPKMFQAHLVLVVSEAIGICTDSDNMMLDVQLMDWYLKAFEKSVILYTSHMSSLHVYGHNMTSNGSFVSSCLLGSSQTTFESYLLQVTVDKLYLLTAKSKSSWDSYLSNMSFGTNADLVAASVSYVKENLCIFDESFRDEVLSISNCIILGCSSDDMSETLFHKKGETNHEDMYLFASILKLMSSSMLKAVWYLRYVCLKSLRDVSLSKEYEYVVGILGCFQQFSIHLPIQNFLCETMQSYPERHKVSKWMLLHLLGLLSLSFLCGIDFLVKDCLFTMMILLNLFIFEEGDLKALGSLICSETKSSSSKLSDKVEGVLEVRKSSQLISSNIQKIQDMYFR
ncbi:hypothetical protein JCGZ_07971 [Jatropha curcas]|uniref:DUF7812 domain-containing protein n=2 Tax=Jatropha curcas TaxID=180498 RepID=A0A067LQS7_JATCU|nr:hypothetical protein JCGZ_07971 [Jatropha curcas]